MKQRRKKRKAEVSRTRMVQCLGSVLGLCDGKKVGCPHFFPHKKTPDCTETFFCSRLSSIQNRPVCCKTDKECRKLQGKIRKRKVKVVKPKRRRHKR